MADDPEQPEGRGRGRPRAVLTYEQEVQIEALAATLNMQQIADFFGIARSTLAKMLDEDPELRARYDKGKAIAINDIAGALITKARKGDTASQIFYLKTQAGWRETNKVEVSGPDGGPVQAIDVTKLSDAAIAEMLAVLDDQKADPAGD